MKNHQTFSTYLPVFTGFYNSVFEISPDLIKSEEQYYNDIRNAASLPLLDSDKFVWDENKYYLQYSQALCFSMVDIIKETLKLDINITFEKLVQPKYYNYSNDVIYCVIQLNVFSFLRLIYKNKLAIDKYFDKKYRSRSGFISFYSNSFDGWVDDYRKKELNMEHAIGAIFDALLNIHGITCIDLALQSIEPSLTLSNYSEVLPVHILSI